MINPILIPELKELIHTHDSETFSKFCQQTQPQTVAELIAGLDSEEIWELLRMLEVPQQAEIFSFLELDKQAELATIHSHREMARLLEEMPRRPGRPGTTSG